MTHDEICLFCKNWEEYPVVPDESGEYSRAVFLWANSKSAKVRPIDEHAWYIQSECGISDTVAFHHRMIEEGYLERDPISVSLNTLKTDDLKTLAKVLKIKVSGKKSELIERICEAANETFLHEQAPVTYSLTEKGRKYLNDKDDCIQIHKHHWISWEEYYSYKVLHPGKGFKEICKSVLKRKAKDDTGNCGSAYYIQMAKIEDEYGDKTLALRYLLQMLYIRVSGICGYSSYLFYLLGDYDINMMENLFSSTFSFGGFELIREHEPYYDDKMIDELYEWKLPVMLCEKEDFIKIVHGIFEETYDHEQCMEWLYGQYIDFLESIVA